MISFRVLVAVLVFALAVVVIIAWPAKGARAGITLDQLSPSFGDQVTFTISDTKNRPWVDVHCYQGDLLVYSHTNDYTPGSVTGQVFTLGPTTLWQSGGADCVARLLDKNTGRFPGRTLASTDFVVAG